jgi:tetratricopeptide (TPR) repeat protein
MKVGICVVVAASLSFGATRTARALPIAACDNLDVAARTEIINSWLSTPRQKAAGYNNRGFIYMDQGRCDLALPDFAQAIAIDQYSSSAYSNQGNCYYESKRYRDAVNSFTKAIDSWPHTGASTTEESSDGGNTVRVRKKNPHVYYFNRGNAYEALGLNDLALKDYREVIRLDPTYDNVAQKLRRLSGVKAAPSSSSAPPLPPPVSGSDLLAPPSNWLVLHRLRRPAGDETGARLG